MRPSARLLMTGLLAIGLAGAAIPAKADSFIDILTGATSYTFTGTGSGGTPPSAITISTTGFSGMAVDSANIPAIGTYTFGPMNTTTASVSSGNFTLPGPVANNTESFAYLAPDGDALSGTATWTLVRDSTLAPSMVGVLHYTVGAGSDAAFQAAFGAVGIPMTSQSFDMTVDVHSSLDSIAPVGGSTTSMVSTGQFIPQGVSVPEPATLGLLALGLLGGAGAGFARRQRPN